MEQRWIPVSERLPEEYGSYLVAWRSVLQSKEMVEKLTGGLPHFFEILEFDPDDEANWIESIEQSTGEYEILAWMPLPEPYHEGRSKQTNADRIRNMTDEELADFLREFLIDNNHEPDTSELYEWLRAESEE